MRSVYYVIKEWLPSLPKCRQTTRASVTLTRSSYVLFYAQIFWEYVGSDRTQDINGSRSFSEAQRFVSMRPTPAPSATPTLSSIVEGTAQGFDRLNLDLRCRILEIERSCAAWRCEEYRRLFEQVSGDLGAAREGGEREQPVATSSRSIPASPSAAFPGSRPQQPRSLLPNPVVRQDNQVRRRHERLSTPMELELPEIARRGKQENGDIFNGVLSALCNDNSPRNRAAIFSASGLDDYQLAQQEVAHARNTPDIPWPTFTSIFGGSLHSERPICRRVPGYNKGNFICADNIAQPFAPKRIGEPGVILFAPGLELLEDIKDTFHVLVDSSAGPRKTRLRYCGVYTKVRTPYMEVAFHEWRSLSAECRVKLLRNFERSRPVRDAHARSTLRKRNNFVSHPSLAEIHEWTRKYNEGSEIMERGAIREAFNSGAEVSSQLGCRLGIVGLTAFSMNRNSVSNSSFVSGTTPT
ncbi:hypothetical protein EI94DRAFT_852065 [Lactarius quietus]|nr:hypothetical protein EI94DRAFT_852065 [Lactarius quietus]